MLGSEGIHSTLPDDLPLREVLMCLVVIMPKLSKHQLHHQICAQKRAQDRKKRVKHQFAKEEYFLSLLRSICQSELSKDPIETCFADAGFQCSENKRSLKKSISLLVWAILWSVIVSKPTFEFACLMYQQLCAKFNVRPVSQRTMYRTLARSTMDKDTTSKVTNRCALAKAMKLLAERVTQSIRECLPGQQGVTCQQQSLELLQTQVPGLQDIIAIDGSEISLPNEQNSDKSKGKTGAAIKLHALVNVLSGVFYGFNVDNGVSNEREAALELVKSYDNREKSLILADAGYTSNNFLLTLVKLGCLFITKGKYNTSPLVTKAWCYETDINDLNASRVLVESKQSIDLGQFCANDKMQQEFLEVPLSFIINSQQFAHSTYSFTFVLNNGLILHKIYQPGNKNNKENSDDKAHWVSFYTNLPLSIDINAVGALYRLRWQIELQFKALKSFNAVGQMSHLSNEMCQVFLYASIIVHSLKEYLAHCGYSACNQDKVINASFLAASSDMAAVLITYLPQIFTRADLVSPNESEVIVDTLTIISRYNRRSNPCKKELQQGKSLNAIYKILAHSLYPTGTS